MPLALVADSDESVDAGDGQGAVADGEADALGRASADVAGGEDSGDGGFQRAGLAIFERPLAGAKGVGAGEDVAEGIAGEGFGEPGAAGFSADENEDGGERQCLARDIFLR